MGKRIQKVCTASQGMLGRERLSSGEGLWIIPCEAVHTFWMRFPIDLVYLDSKKRIRKLVSEVPAWRLSACLRAHSVLELPPGTIRETQTQRGDTLAFLASLHGQRKFRRPECMMWPERAIGDSGKSFLGHEHRFRRVLFTKMPRTVEQQNFAAA